MTLARKVDSTPKAGPWCEASVHVTPIDTASRRLREFRTRKKGIPIHQCGDQVAFEVAGEMLCRAHAQQEALALLVGGSVPRR